MKKNFTVINVSLAVAMVVHVVTLCLAHNNAATSFPWYIWLFMVLFYLPVFGLANLFTFIFKGLSHARVRLIALNVGILAAVALNVLLYFFLQLVGVTVYPIDATPMVLAVIYLPMLLISNCVLGIFAIREKTHEGRMHKAK